MIQDRYKKENYKMEKLQHRSRELDLVENNAKLLDELLGHYSASSSQSETDLIEELKKLDLKYILIWRRLFIDSFYSQKISSLICPSLYTLQCNLLND